MNIIKEKPRVSYGLLIKSRQRPTFPGFRDGAEITERKEITERRRGLLLSLCFPGFPPGPIIPTKSWPKAGQKVAKNC